MGLIDQCGESDAGRLVPGVSRVVTTRVLGCGEDDEILILEFLKNVLPT